MSSRPITDYALLSDRHSAALVSRTARSTGWAGRHGPTESLRICRACGARTPANLEHMIQVFCCHPAALVARELRPAAGVCMNEVAVTNAPSSMTERSQRRADRPPHEPCSDEAHQGGIDHDPEQHLQVVHGEVDSPATMTVEQTIAATIASTITEG